MRRFICRVIGHRDDYIWGRCLRCGRPTDHIGVE